MRVAILSYSSHALGGGVASVTRNLVEGLADKVDLHVVCEKGAFQDSHARCYELPDLHIPHGSFLTIHMSAHNIVRTIEQIDPDIVHANYVHMLALVSHSIRKKRPLIVTAHAVPYRELQGLFQYPTFGWEFLAGFFLFPYWHLVDRDVLHDSDLAVAVSPLVRRDLIQIYHLSPQDIVVVPNAVDTSRFAPGKPGAVKNGKPNLLSVGRLVHSKGFAQLVRSMRTVCNEEKDVCLRIVGTGPEMHSLKRLAGNLGLTDNIVFLGHVSHDRLTVEYLNSDLVVVPSVYEPYSMVALEAMSCGKPVAMSNNVGIAELLPRESYVLIDPSNMESTARSLVAALRDPERLTELGRKGRLLAEREYSPEASAMRMIEVYESVLQKRTNTRQDSLH